MNREQRRALKKESRFQTFLEMKDGSTMPLGPVANKEFCQRVCEGVNRKLIEGIKSVNPISGAFMQPVLAN